jgi:PAS domain S-box-containing protein
LAAARHLVEAERQRYQDLFEFAPDGYLVTDAKGTIREANRAAAELLRAPQANLVGKPLTTYVARDERAAFQSQLALLADAERMADWEVHLKPYGAKPFPASITVAAAHDVQGEATGFRWQVRDITRRKQGQSRREALLEALRQAHDELEIRVQERTADLQAEVAEREAAQAALKQERDFVAAVLDTVGALVIVLDRDGRIVRFNRACQQTTGYTFDEVEGRCCWDFLLVPEEVETVRATFDNLRGGQFPNEFENYWVARDGSRRLIAWTNTAIPGPEGRGEYIIGTGLDVTEHRLAQSQREAALEALREARDYLDNLLTYANAPIIVWDPDFKVTRFNGAFEQLTGLKAGDVLGRNLDILFPEERKQEAMAHIRRTVAGERWEIVEIPIRRVDGTLRTVLWNSATLYAADGTTAMATIAQGQDITERVQAESQREAALAERERHMAQLDALIRISEEILAERTVGGLLQRITDAARELTGAGLGVAGHGYRDGVFEVGAASRAESLASCPPGTLFTIQQGGVYLELIERAASIRLTDEELRARPAWWGLPEGHAPLRGLLGARLVGRDGQAEGLIMVSGKGRGSDFTAEDEALLAQLAALASLAMQHIQARDEAERRADELDTVFSAITEAVVVYDASGRVVRANPATNAVYGVEAVGSDRATIAQRLFLRHPDGRPVIAQELAAARALRGERVRGERFILTAADGHDITILISAAPLLADGRLTGSVVVWRDVTERERLLEELKTALAEKEVLMREIYHRVKNNIQTLIYLMDMQTEFIADPDSRAMIHELQVRARTMSLVHEQLYQSGNLAQVDFGAYLNNLMANLSRAFWADRPIVWDIDAADVLLGVDTAIPCGLIVNELLTNALKYAFPNARPVVERGETECKIRVEFRAEGNRFTLIVADNGVGLPPGLDWQTTKSLGLQLINVLACHQLGGQMEVDTQAGTTFTITFAERKKR